MIYRFEDFELDAARFELRRAGVVLGVEPQVLSLLLLLASNPDRLVSKDEIIEKVWNNRIVSEAAVAARVKSARKVLGDDGKQQRLVRTIHGKGFRFVGNVVFARSASLTVGMEHTVISAPANIEQAKPSIAVLPFRLVGESGANAFIVDALADELIGDLARLHWLFVIARGSTFRFRGEQVDCQAVGAALGVRYCLTGSLAFSRGGVVLSVELVDTASGGIIWAETYSDAIERLAEMQCDVASNIVAALEIRIQLHEAQRARSQDLERLDAWSAYHVGLDHMFRFNRADNLRASEMFERALELSPQFARAYAGLSFTRFQNAFLNYGPDRSSEVDAARSLAEKALQLDRLDPFCQLNMGRSFWLCGDLAGSVEWLDRSIAACPNYAQGVYCRAWASTLSGDAEIGENDARLALRLSPLDPLRYAMIATCSLGEAIKENYEEAATLGERAARSPGAHKHIALIAAITTRLAGQSDASEQWVGVAKRMDPSLTANDFLRSFPFAPSAARERFERVLEDLRL